MLTVKTLIPHHNAYGASFSKAQGDQYTVPAGEVAVLVDQGLVEVAGEAEEPAAALPAGDIDAGE